MDAPVCLKRARKEMLMALGATSPQAARVHKQLADEYVVKAVREIERDPNRKRDWAELRPSRAVR